MKRMSGYVWVAGLFVVIAMLVMPNAAWAMGASPAPQSSGTQSSGSQAVDRSATPDEVTTSDGSTLQGTITGMLSGKLSIKNKFASTIEVTQSKVATINTTSQLDIVMYDSRRLRGTLVTGADGSIVITPADGSAAITVAWRDIDELWQLPPNWSGSVTFGFSENSGNSEAIAGNIGLDGTRRGENNRFTGKAAYSINETFGDAAVRKASGQLSYSHYFRPRVYADLTEEILHDLGQDLTIQSATHIGIGYDLVERPKSLLTVEFGVGVIINRYDVDIDNDDTNFSGRGEVNLKIPFDHGISLTDDLVFFIHNSSHLTNTLVVSFKLTSDWKFKVTSNLQVSSDPSILADTWDHQTVMGITYSF